jgi:hypothetical protein
MQKYRVKTTHEWKKSTQGEKEKICNLIEKLAQVKGTETTKARRKQR